MASQPARNRLQQRQNGAQSVTSGVSSRTSSPIPLTSALPKSLNNSLIHKSNSISSEENQNQVVRGTTFSIVPKQRKALKGMRSFSESSEDTSSNLQQPLDPQTMLPKANNNQFIVSATVHMVDT